MKKFIFLSLISFIFCFTIVESNSFDISILEDREESKVIEFTINDFEISRVEINGNQHSRIIVPGHITTFLKKGYPELPKFSGNIIIPDDGIMDFKILNAKYETIKLEPFIPSKGNLKRNIDPSTVPYTWSDFYERDEWFPEQNVELSNAYILRDFRGQSVKFNPFQYNPVRGELRVTKQIVVEVYKKSPGGTNVFVRKKNIINKPFKEIYKNFFLNFSTATSRYPHLSEVVGNMLIITADAYNSYMDDFVYWKKKKGIPVEIVDVSTIGNTSSQIKAYIQNKYDNEGVTWVLLVGNESDVSTIAGSYDETSDPVYAYLAGSDNYLDAFISRFSANNATHVENQVSRSVAYERFPQEGADWYHRACGTATSEGSPTDCERLSWVNDTLHAYTYTSEDQLCEPSATDAQVLGAINNGRSILNHIGHGTETGFGTQTAFWIDIDEIAGLSNTDMLPFVFLVACLTGDFDAVTTCCAESWLWAGSPAAPTGGIASYGASVLQSWVPPTLAQLHGNGLLKREEAVTIGGITYNGSMYMLDQSGDLEMLETWHIFGDASIDLRTDTPDTLVVTHPDTYQPSPTTFTVTVKDEDEVTPIEDALVCLWIYSQSPELHTADYTDATGEITFNISPQSDGDTMWVTVTKHNYKPYEGYATLATGAPSVPTLYNLFNYARDFSTTPTLTFSSTDEEGNQIEYEVHWDTDPAFGSPNTSTIGLYESGAIASFTFPSPLTDGETYYWKVKARDPGGSNYWGGFSEVRSFTIGTSLPTYTCTWYQTTGNQFSDDNLVDVAVEDESVILLPAGEVAVDTILKEDFESGNLPAGWSVVDGDGDGNTWYVTTTGKADLDGNEPPSAGSYYAYYSDDDMGSSHSTADEYLYSPARPIGNADSLFLQYGWGFRLYQTGEQLQTRVRFHNGTSWGSWNPVAAHSGSGSGNNSIDLSSNLPSDSIQVLWHYDDGGNWGWATAVDNILFITKNILTNTAGSITGTPVVFEELDNVYTRTSWGSIVWDKSTADDSIAIQLEYLSGGTWALVPEGDLPGNSSGFLTDAASGTLSIDVLVPATYDTIRLVGHLYRPDGRSLDDPSLLAWEVGNLSELSIFLTEFYATCNRGEVDIYWRTESEVDNMSWVIERANRPEGNWEETGTLPGQGTKPIPTEYTYTDVNVGKDGRYYYRLLSIDGDGNREEYGPISVTVSGSIPKVYALHNVNPNPFSISSVIYYDIPKRSYVSLKIYDISGRLIRTLISNDVEPGYYSILWDGCNKNGNKVANGTYFLRMNAEQYIKTQKLLLVK
jgi:hypothetical protein